MTKNALIIFVRKPEKGKVKTRLAASLGDEAALFIYQKLLQHTLEITEAVDADKVVFYAGEIEEEDMWQRKGYVKQKQTDGDLGHRINDAFDTVLRLGYGKACIVGSDCYELTTDVIEDAFIALERSKVVIGPAHDGGYYLLGMKRLYSPLLQNKSWSTSTVLSDTLQTAEQMGLTVVQLPTLHDVDEAANVPEEWLTAVKS